MSTILGDPDNLAFVMNVNYSECHVNRIVVLRVDKEGTRIYFFYLEFSFLASGVCMYVCI